VKQRTSIDTIGRSPTPIDASPGTRFVDYAYAHTPWGTQLREPINALIRWSTPLMIRGPRAMHSAPTGSWWHFLPYSPVVRQ
jgi:hypothetical protein